MLSELRAVVFGMNESSACGEDGLNIRMVRMSFDAIGPVIMHLVNSSISLGSPLVLEALASSSYSRNRRSLEPIQLPVNLHRSCYLQNCRAGRPSHGSSEGDLMLKRRELYHWKGCDMGS